jgi:hypothetical protein
LVEGNDIKHRTCRAMDTHVVISPEGEVYTPCYHYSNYKLTPRAGIDYLLKSDQWKYLASKAGTYDFCKGCSIYCYMDASLFFKHPVTSLATLLLHLVKIRGTHKPLPEQVAMLNEVLANA